MKNLTRQQFEKLATAGTIRKPNGHTPVGEDLCETALEFGLANGYSLADICHFYAHFQRTMRAGHDEGSSETQLIDAAYDKFVNDAAVLASTLIDAAKGLERRALSSTVLMLLNGVARSTTWLSNFFLPRKR